MPLSDEQLIERVRSSQRHRLPVGALCLILGVAIVVGSLCGIQYLRMQSLGVLSELDPAHPPTTEESQRTFNHVQFEMGLGLGFVACAGMSVGASLAASGFVKMVMQNRKDSLLLQSWDKRAK